MTPETRGITIGEIQTNLLQSIKELVLSIRERITPDDRRIWEPDSSCVPYFLNNSITLSATAINLMLEWALPDEHVQVIKKIHAKNAGATIVVKQSSNLQIMRGDGNPGFVSTVSGTIGIQLTGTLQNVREPGATLNQPGIAVWGNTAEHFYDTNIVLDKPGKYRLICNSLSNTNIQLVSMFGYTFPRNPKTFRN